MTCLQFFVCLASDHLCRPAQQSVKPSCPSSACLGSSSTSCSQHVQPRYVRHSAVNLLSDIYKTGENGDTPDQAFEAVSYTTLLALIELTLQTGTYGSLRTSIESSGSNQAASHHQDMQHPSLMPQSQHAGSIDHHANSTPASLHTVSWQHGVLSAAQAQATQQLEVNQPAVQECKYACIKHLTSLDEDHCMSACLVERQHASLLVCIKSWHTCNAATRLS